jgi:hypothetical protein
MSFDVKHISYAHNFIIPLCGSIKKMMMTSKDIFTIVDLCSRNLIHALAFMKPPKRKRKLKVCADFIYGTKQRTTKKIVKNKKKKKSSLSLTPSLSSSSPSPAPSSPSLATSFLPSPTDSQSLSFSHNQEDIWTKTSSGFFLWKLISRQMTQKPTGVGKNDDLTWKRFQISGAPSCVYSDLFGTTNTSISLTTDEEINQVFGNLQRKYRNGGFAKVMKPFIMVMTPKMLRANFRYCVFEQNGEESAWIAPHHAAYVGAL